MISPAHAFEARWRWPILLALSATIPAFYLEMLHTGPSWLAGSVYAFAALVLTAATWLRGWRPLRRAPLRSAQGLELVLIPGLILAAALPPSSSSNAALAMRLVLALPILLRMLMAVRHLLARQGLGYLLSLAVVVVGLCGLGFWWLEPSANSLADGLWLAFTTAATVGYGDIVPSTPASRIFAIFVVLLGFGVLSLVTAAIAATMVEGQERRAEREILQAMHADMQRLHHEISQLRRELQRPPEAAEMAETAESEASRARSWATRSNPSKSSESTSS